MNNTMNNTIDNENIIYKLLTYEEYLTFQQTKLFIGNELDQRDGYIHMSSNEIQYQRVRNKFYTPEQHVVLVKINKQLCQALKYEAIKTGDIYPHEYGTLSFDWVVGVEDLPAQ